MDFIIHDTTTGEILRYGSCPAASDLANQVHASNEGVLQATYVPGTVVNSVLVPLSAADVQAAWVADRKSHIQAAITQKKRTPTP